MVVVVDRWSLFGGDGQLKFDCTSKFLLELEHKLKLKLKYLILEDSTFTFETYY